MAPSSVQTDSVHQCCKCNTILYFNFLGCISTFTLLSRRTYRNTY